MRHLLLTLLLIIPGLLVVAVSSHFAVQDWRQLDLAYDHYRAVAASAADLRAVTIAYQAQDIHRTNIIADGVWALQGALLFAVGLVGLCLLPRKPRS
jgi:hypothetical protein